MYAAVLSVAVCLGQSDQDPFELSPPSRTAQLQRLTAFKLTPQQDALLLQWADTDDSVRGLVEPRQASPGRPVEVSVAVEPRSGPPFDGPVTLSLGPSDGSGSRQSTTVTRPPGERLWRATFTPSQTGPHTLEVAFRTTRYKAVRGALKVEVDPRLFQGLVLGGLLLLALVLARAFFVATGRPSSSPVHPAP